MSIFVTKSFLPPIEEYKYYLNKIYESGTLTNQGDLVYELEDKLKTFLEVENLHFINNGTNALQLALSSLSINEGEIITTPFSYVATVSSILWQGLTPVFVDIELDNFTIDAAKIEKKITSKTKAILAVHVFGYACNVKEIEQIAIKHNLKAIYDGAHAFGVKYKGKSLLSYGDISTLSFHATKLFHTVEGGACVIKDKNVSEKLDVQKRFGHIGDEHFCLGINAKNSEFHSAMGLANFPYIKQIIKKRKRVSKLYDSLLKDLLIYPKTQESLEYNYSYYPVIFKSEDELLKVFEALAKEDIYPRRYFYPSLNELPYLKEKQNCPISENISKRIACLPLYPDLEEQNILKICRIIKSVL